MECVQSCGHPQAQESFELVKKKKVRHLLFFSVINTVKAASGLSRGKLCSPRLITESVHSDMVGMSCP